MEDEEDEKMVRLVLVRQSQGMYGTLGSLFTTDGQPFKSIKTLELPWRNNARGISRIPPGTYNCTKVDSPRFGKAYTVRDVPGRSHVLIHHGNFAGDVSLNFRSDSNGCILLGTGVAILQGQTAITSSRMARALFENELGFEPFQLHITEEM